VPIYSYKYNGNLGIKGITPQPIPLLPLLPLLLLYYYNYYYICILYYIFMNDFF